MECQAMCALAACGLKLPDFPERKGGIWQGKIRRCGGPPVYGNLEIGMKRAAGKMQICPD